MNQACAKNAQKKSKPYVFLTYGEPRGRSPHKKIIPDRIQLTVDCPDMFETIEI
jgi:hypothetical protein